MRVSINAFGVDALKARIGARLPAAAAALALGAAAPIVAAQSAEPAIVEYTAAYDVDYKGRNLGTAQFSVEPSEAGTYVFESRTRARGLLRLARPNPLLERSRFEIVDGRIRPRSYVYEDGSRKGEDNFRAQFDWEAGAVVVTRESGRAEYPLEPRVLDRGSMQVALMRDLARGRSVGPYVLADEDGLKTYHYEHETDSRIETPAGGFETRVYVQQREGSSRITRLWVAPSLEFLPVRIAQFRDGELYTDFTLESVDGL